MFLFLNRECVHSMNWLVCTLHELATKFNTETSPVAVRGPLLSPQLKECSPSNSSDVASIAVHTHMTWQVSTSGHLHLGKRNRKTLPFDVSCSRYVSRSQLGH